MNRDCLEIGTIQAFLDGELGHDEVSRVSTHAAACDACAFLLAEAEEESAAVFPALEREFDTLVPTQRLWARINDSISAEKESRPFWQKVWGIFAASLANPSFAAAMGILIVLGAASVIYLNRPAPASYVASTAPVQSSPVLALPAETASRSTSAPAAPDVVAVPGRNVITAERAAFRPERRSPSPTSGAAAPAVSNAAYMPGEESYVRTISSLKKTVEDQKDAVLRPSERIAYEKDLAVVNDTISKMRKEVRKNPKNESARQVLYNSYQNKIDLMNSVAQKEELVASLR